jgi:glycosyltransferase involved in cell wall biosynthesis
MKTYPKFSVVIPMFNSIDHIERAIASVLQQSVRATEIILVDDGSIDSAASIVKERFSGITIITQHNQGVGVARNTGIEFSSCDWVAFLDADDFWLPNHLEVVSRVILNFPEASVVSTRIQSWTPGSPLEIRQQKIFDSTIDYFVEQTIKPGVITSSTAVVKRETFADVGDFKTIKIGEDLDMWERLALQFTFAHSNEVTSVYVQNQSGAMANFGRNITSDLKRNNQSFYSSQNLTNISCSKPRKTLQRYQNRLTYTSVKSLLKLNQIDLGKNMASEISGSATTKHRIILRIISLCPNVVLRFLVKLKS